jgi:hypothetical protein
MALLHHAGQIVPVMAFLMPSSALPDGHRALRLRSNLNSGRENRAASTGHEGAALDIDQMVQARAAVLRVSRE